MQHEQVIEHIVNWLKDYAQKAGVKGFVVGVSGGIDSALTSTLCARTGMEVLCLEMPIHQAKSQVSRAANHIFWLKQNYPNVRSEWINMTAVFDSLIEVLPDAAGQESQMLSLANTRARLRMTCLYYFAGIHGYLVAGTGNKVEDFGVLEAPPTDGLWGDSRTDEDQIGASYPELEWAMGMAESGKRVSDFEGRQREVFEIYSRLHAVNRHKMIPIPVCEIPKSLKSTA
jgi:NAD+ synthase